MLAAAAFGVPYFGLDDARQGIVHVVGPEQGFTLPGATVVCGDSHTATHGAFGALAFGIGTSEVEHVLATQCLVLRKAKAAGIVKNIGFSAHNEDVACQLIATGEFDSILTAFNYMSWTVGGFGQRMMAAAQDQGNAPPCHMLPRAALAFAG